LLERAPRATGPRRVERTGEFEQVNHSERAEEWLKDTRAAPEAGWELVDSSCCKNKVGQRKSPRPRKSVSAQWGGTFDTQSCAKAPQQLTGPSASGATSMRKGPLHLRSDHTTHALSRIMSDVEAHRQSTQLTRRHCWCTSSGGHDADRTRQKSGRRFDRCFKIGSAGLVGLESSRPRDARKRGGARPGRKEARTPADRGVAPRQTATAVAVPWRTPSCLQPGRILLGETGARPGDRNE